MTKSASASGLITIDDGGQPAAAPAPAVKHTAAKPAPEAPAEEAAEVEAEVSKPVAAPVASPSIRKMARELGIDLSRVRGSEPGGRIVVGDIRAYLARLQKAAAKPVPAAATAPARPAAEQIDFSKWGPVRKQPLTPLRQVIARRMWENWNAVPRVTQFDDADFTRLNELRAKFAAAYEKKGAKLTLTPLVLKALVETLKKHPIFNSSLDEAAQEVVIKEYFHIGIAVDTEQGLIVPVIRDVDKKSVFDLAKELEQLGAKGAGPQGERRRTQRRHIHDFEPGRDWRGAFHAHRQQTGGGDSRPRPRRAEAGRPRRQD